MRSVKPIEFFAESSRIRAKRIRRLRKGETSVVDREIVCDGETFSPEEIQNRRNDRYRKFVADAFFSILSSDLREVAAELHAKRNAVPKSTKFVPVELGLL